MGNAMSQNCKPKCDPANEPINSALDNFIAPFLSGKQLRGLYEYFAQEYAL